MDTIIQTINTLADAVLPWLVIFEIQIVVLGLFILAVDVLFKNMPMWVRYSLWMLVLLKAFVPPFIPAPEPFAVEVVSAVTLPSLQSVSSAPSVVATAAIEEPVSLSHNAVLVLLIVALSGGRIVRIVLSTVQWRRLIASSFPLPEGYGPDLITEERRPALLLNERIASPVTLGFLKPVILFHPYHLRDRDAFNAILAHEMAHVRRRDELFLWLQELALILHPSNPMLWLANVRLHRYRERLCDAHAIQAADIDPRAYGRVLIQQLERASIHAEINRSGTFFFESKRSLKQRIQSLFNQKEIDMVPLKTTRAALLVICAALLLPLSWNCSEDDRQPKTRQYYEMGDPVSAVTLDTLPEMVRADQTGFNLRNLYFSLHEVQTEISESFLLNVSIDAQGRTGKIDVLQGFNSAHVDALLQDMKETKWTPAFMNGVPVACEIRLPFRYSIMTQPGIEHHVAKKSPTGLYDEPPRLVDPDKFYRELVYPEILLRAGIEGTVQLQVTILANGWVEKVHVLKSPHPALSEAAKTAVEKALWKPAYKEGKAVSWVDVILPVNFKLPGKAK